jgi:hypothetical protein
MVNPNTLILFLHNFCFVKIEKPVEQKEEEKKADDPPEDDVVFVAFARVFSGTVKMGQTLYVLGPKHDPKDAIAKVYYKSLLQAKHNHVYWFTVNIFNTKYKIGYYKYLNLVCLLIT